jgi:hypothetical protein
MPALVAGIHVFLLSRGTVDSPAMTDFLGPDNRARDSHGKTPSDQRKAAIRHAQ